jgi:cysteinyl-tRNA synthetase
LIASSGARSYLESEMHADAKTASVAVIEALGDDLNTPALLTVLREEAKAAKGNRHLAAKLLTSLEMLGFLRRDRLGVFESGLASIGDFELPAEAGTLANRLRAAYANGDSARVAELVAELEGRFPSATVDLRENGSLVLREKAGDLEGRIQALIDGRLAARAARNWAESDRIRDELKGMGVQLRDNKDGTTTWEIARA